MCLSSLERANKILTYLSVTGSRERDSTSRKEFIKKKKKKKIAEQRYKLLVTLTRFSSP